MQCQIVVAISLVILRLWQKVGSWSNFIKTELEEVSTSGHAFHPTQAIKLELGELVKWMIMMIVP